MEEKPEIGSLIEDLAREILEDSLGDGVPLGTKQESFKLLTTYYVGITRVGAKLKDPAEDDETMSLSAMKRAVNAHDIQ